MQFTANILTQIVCMLVMSNQTKISMVIVNFVALVAIARLDEAFFEYTQSNLKDRLYKQQFILPLEGESQSAGKK